MGRHGTRSSINGPRVPPGGYTEKKKTLMTSSAGKKRQKPANGKLLPQPSTHQSPPFDFPSQVTFDYTLRQGGFSTILDFMKNGNQGVKEKILNECNMILECRVCKNLFRSSSDFLIHKDKFCRDNFERLSGGGLEELLRLAHRSFQLCADPAKPFDFQKDLIPNKPGADICEDRKSQELDPEELELMSISKNSEEGIPRQVSRGVNGEMRMRGSYKSEEKALAGILGPDGKAEAVGKPSTIQAIVDRLTAQWETKKEEEVKAESSLKCSTCNMVCPTEKTLRIHIRHYHKRKRKATDSLNGLTKVKVKVKRMDTKEESVKKPKCPGSKKSTKTDKIGHFPSFTDTKIAKTWPMNQMRKPKNSDRITNLSQATSNSTLPSTFRRLTNNSFSTTLSSGTSSDETALSLTKILPPKTLPQRNKKCRRESELEPGHNLYALSFTTPQQSKELEDEYIKPSTPPPIFHLMGVKRLSCLKCTTEFKTEKEMSVHLGSCGNHNRRERISILDRHDYLKPSPIAEEKPKRERRSATKLERKLPRLGMKKSLNKKMTYHAETLRKETKSKTQRNSKSWIDAEYRPSLKKRILDRMTKEENSFNNNENEVENGSRNKSTHEDTVPVEVGCNCSAEVQESNKTESLSDPSLPKHHTLTNVENPVIGISPKNT